ncbi:MAG: phosphoenolpyruvate synthase, partial [Candidatus Omnitrophota bacterium]
TTTAFQKFLDANPGLREKIFTLINDIDWSNPKSIEHTSEKIKQIILSGKMPEEIYTMIRSSYARLEKLGGMKDVPCAVRSSAVAEDSPNFSWAGQFRTELNQRGIYQILQAIQLNWAELYNPDALSYGHQNGIDPRKFSMGVVVQRMINSEKSGVAFGLESETGFRATPGGLEGVYYIEGVYGLGEGMVQNIQEPDGFLVVKTPQGEFKIIERSFGSKLDQIVYREGMGGTEKRKVPSELSSKWVFSPEEVMAIARAVDMIGRHYGTPQDVEFAWEKGRLYILQSRNETKFSRRPLDLIEWSIKKVSSQVAESAKIIARGEGVGARGAGVGKVVIIDENSPIPVRQQAERVQEGDVIVAYRTDPSLVDAMRRAGLVITEIGGKNSHAAIVSREYNLNAVIGVKGAMRIFAEGQVVTLDADRGVIYSGALPLVESKVSYHISDLPLTGRTRIGILSFDTARVRSLFALGLYDSFYGIGLMRAEFALQNIGIHPLAILDYDAGKITDQELKTEIAQKVKGYSSAREYFVEKLSSAILSNSLILRGGQKVIYRTTDFKSNEYEDMLGGSIYEKPEANPMLGNRGLQRMISPQYQEAFDMELEAFLDAWSQNPDKIAIMVPFVRTPNDLAIFRQILEAKIRSMGLKGMPEIVLMYELPANVFQITDFIREGINGISIGSNDLTQFILAVDRDSGLFKGAGSEEYDAVNRAVLRAIGIGIRASQASGVKTGICGQAPSDHPDIYPAILVALGIDSISVVPDVFHKVVEAVARAEENPEAGNRFLSGLDLFLDYNHSLPQTVEQKIVDSNDIILDLGIHPLALLAFDQGRLKDDPDVFYEIASLIQESPDEVLPTAARIYSDHVYNIVSERLKSDGNVVYKTGSLLSTQYASLLGGYLFEKPEANPILGAFGMYRMLHYGSEDGSISMQDIFRMEMDAVLRAARDRGKTISIMLDMVRTLKELEEAISIINETIRTTGISPDKVRIGLNVSTPANVLLIRDFIEQGDLDFVSVDRDRLACYILGIDSLDMVSPSAVESALEIPLKMVYTALVRAGIPLGISRY